MLDKLQPGERLHGIDALRGIAMILGIFLHATIAYKEYPLPTWPHDMSYHNLAYDYTYGFLHSFRMPLFFLIAGFFCRFLIHRIGVKQFIIHRWKRIFIPFILSLLLILPITVFPFLVFQNSAAYGSNWAENFRVSFKQLFHWNGMAHLWFLYYLIIYYAVILASMRLVQIIGLNKVITYFNKRLLYDRYRNLYLFILCITATFLILLTTSELFVHVDTGLIPGFTYLAFFGLFFILGWFIHINQDFLRIAVRFAWLFFVLGLLFSVATFYLEYFPLRGEHQKSLIISYKFTVSCQTALLVFGSMGLFLKLFKKESRFWRYISDASYWMYLLHLSLVAGFQVIFMNSVVPGWLRFWLALSIALFLTILTYSLFIRYNIIGEYLHGKRVKQTRINKGV